MTNRRVIPNDKVNLKLILVSGHTHEFLFSPYATAQEISDSVYNDWPEKWVREDRPEKNILRLIYQGRFLHGNVTLAALNLHTGRTTVMHLVNREKLPEPNSQNDLRKEKRRSNVNAAAACCTIT